MDSIDKKLLLIETYMIALGENLESAKNYFPGEIDEAARALEETAAMQEQDLTEEQKAVLTALKETDMRDYFNAMRKIRCKYSEGAIALAQRERIDALRERIEETERNKTALERSPKYTQLAEQYLDQIEEIREKIRQRKVLFCKERDAYFAFAIIGLHELQRRQLVDPDILDKHIGELETFLNRAMKDCISVSPKELIKTYKKELKDIGIHIT